MYTRLPVFIAVLLALAGAVRAQDSAAAHLPTRWDLQTCLDYAKKNNVQLNMLRLNEKSAEQNYLLSKAQRQPTLTGTVPIIYTHSNKNVNGVIGGFQTQSSFSQSYTLSSGVTIYNGGYITNDIRQKNLEIESANLDVLQSINDIT